MRVVNERTNKKKEKKKAVTKVPEMQKKKKKTQQTFLYLDSAVSLNEFKRC